MTEAERIEKDFEDWFEIMSAENTLQYLYIKEALKGAFITGWWKHFYYCKDEGLLKLNNRFDIYQK